MGGKKLPKPKKGDLEEMLNKAIEESKQMKADFEKKMEEMKAKIEKYEAENSRLNILERFKNMWKRKETPKVEDKPTVAETPTETPTGTGSATEERHKAHKSWILEHPIKTVSIGAVAIPVTSHDGREFLWDKAKVFGDWWWNGSQSSDNTEAKQSTPPATPNINEDEIDAAIEKSKTSSEIDWKAFNNRFE